MTAIPKRNVCLMAQGALLLLCSALPAQVASQDSDKKQQGPPPAASTRTGEAAGSPQTKAADQDFTIGADDILAINVWKEPDITRSIPVRSDGKITLPLIGELQASGQTPRQLEIEIASRLKSFISEPEVTVIVQEIRSQRFNILGQVAKPGSYLLSSSATILDAIAMAGGFRDFAKKKSIYVLRQEPDGTQSRLPFNYSDVVKGKNSAQNVKLKPRDTVVIP